LAAAPSGRSRAGGRRVSWGAPGAGNNFHKAQAKECRKVFLKGLLFRAWPVDCFLKKERARKKTCCLNPVTIRLRAQRLRDGKETVAKYGAEIFGFGKYANLQARLCGTPRPSPGHPWPGAALGRPCPSMGRAAKAEKGRPDTRGIDEPFLKLAERNETEL
jgi:hypothetical protein